MKMTKKQVFKAIATEPYLEPGAFLQLGSNENGFSLKENCSMCAVGTILTKAYIKKTGYKSKYYSTGLHEHIADVAEDVTDGLYQNFTVEQAYASGNPFSILSCEFESAIFAENTEDNLRMHALMIVEGFFPEVVEVPI